METEGICRFDERDNVQGRLELKPDTEAWAEYYENHPQLLDRDIKNQGLHDNPVGHPADNLAGAALMSLLRHLGSEELVDGPVAPEKTEMAPERATEKIKSWAAYLGIDLVRIGPLDPMYVYSNKGRTYGRRGPHEKEVGSPIELTHKNAIVLVNAIDTQLLQGAPKKQVMYAIHKAYLQTNVVAIVLAGYIRNLGYPARAQIMRNYQVIIPPIAIDAGVGELGRNGIVISKEFGEAIKMAVVTSDLPLVHDPKARMGIDAVCGACRICAEKCPAGAINHGEKRLIRGVERYRFTPELCFNTWKTTGTDCGVCMVCCPLTRDPELRKRIAERPLTPGEDLPEDIKAIIERMRGEPHDPGAHPPYAWIEEQPDVWKNYRYGKSGS